MNRLTKIESLNKINEKELSLGISGDLGKSWHQKYADSAWIYIGNLPFDLNEGDVLAVFSQYGEVVNLNLVRDRKTGKSKGFCFLCYQDQRSTVLAVDNFNGIKLVGRVVQVDHCENYKMPKYREDMPEEILRIWEEGYARRERRERKRKLHRLEGLVELADGEVSRELRKARKHARRERKQLKRMLRKERERGSRTPDEERGRADDEGRWDERKKKLDDEDMLDVSEWMAWAA
uniref:RRM domain-containing protein n=1 Tax=Globodera pallida TaxID=36090 RepID=A0A183CE42_GLOPA